MNSKVMGYLFQFILPLFLVHPVASRLQQWQWFSGYYWSFLSYRPIEYLDYHAPIPCLAYVYPTNLYLDVLMNPESWERLVMKWLHVLSSVILAAGADRFLVLESSFQTGGINETDKRNSFYEAENIAGFFVLGPKFVFWTWPIQL